MKNHVAFSDLSLPLLCAVFLICSCSWEKEQKGTEEGLLVENIKADLDAAADLSLSMVFDKLVYVPLETSSKSLLTDLQSIQLVDEKIYLFQNEPNNKSLQVFNFKGDFIYEIDGFGDDKGPNRYYGIMDFIIDEDNDKIEVIDFLTKKLFKYRIDDGLFVEAIPTPLSFKSLRKFKNGNYVFRLAEDCGESYEGILVYCDENMRVLKFYFPKPYEQYCEYGFFHYIPFSISSEDGFLFADYFSNNIYKVTDDGIYRSYKYDTKKWVPDEFIDRYMKSKNLIDRLNFHNEVLVDYVTHLRFFEELQNNIFIYHFSDLGGYWNFFNKNTKSNRVFRLSPQSRNVPNDIDFGMPLGIPWAVYEENLIFLLQPYRILNFYNENLTDEQRSKIKSDENNNFYQLVKKIDYYDNPVVVFAKLKPEFQ